MKHTDRRRHPLRAALLAAALAAAPALAFAADCPPLREPRLGELPKTTLNIDKVKDLLRDYHAKHYAEDIAAVAADARGYVERRAHEVKNPAIVLDIDETSLTNWPNIAADDFGFISGGTCTLKPSEPCGFDAWVNKGTAEAITPTRILFNAAKANDVAVFFITGRRERVRDITIQNLVHAGFRGWHRLILRANDDTQRTVEDFKTEQRSRVAAEGYTIIANMGDQMSDINGGFAECGFKLPNPFYFIR